MNTYMVTPEELSSMTLRERLIARRQIEALRARIRDARCAYCGGLSCQHRGDRTWSRR